MSMMMYGQNPYELLDKMREAIMGEIHDYRYYTVLAERVNDAETKKMITGFADDEFHHAESLKAFFQYYGGGATPSGIPEVTVPADLSAAYRERVLAETADYEKYRDWYLMVSDPRLRDLFFQIMTDENEHALRLLLLRQDLQ